MDQDSLPQILPGPFSNTLTHIFANISYFSKHKKYLNLFFPLLTCKLCLLVILMKGILSCLVKRMLQPFYIVYKVVSKTLLERFHALHKRKLYVDYNVLCITKWLLIRAYLSQHQLFLAKAIHFFPVYKNKFDKDQWSWTQLKHKNKLSTYWGWDA